MEYVIKPEGATHLTINKIAVKYQIELPSDFIKW